VSGSDAISPTAHYTGYVWFRAGLSHPALATSQGRLLFEGLAPAMVASRALGGPTLEAYLLARHRALDALLARAIERGGVTQVIEVASGLSPRGWRFARRYGEQIDYIETDLPAMAARKRRALADIGSLGPRHRVVAVDALRDGGDGSLTALADELDHAGAAAIITEGLLGYLPGAEVDALWRRFAGVLRGFAGGHYFSDLHLAGAQTVPVRAFRVLLSAFVRGQVHLHFDDAQAAERALRDCGFTHARVGAAADVAGAHSQAADRGRGDRGRGDRGRRLANIIEASTTS
jgi:O-methyltransferase involved in polyketide biosynthesis